MYPIKILRNNVKTVLNILMLQIWSGRIQHFSDSLLLTIIHPTKRPRKLLKIIDSTSHLPRTFGVATYYRKILLSPYERASGKQYFDIESTEECPKRILPLF